MNHNIEKRAIWIGVIEEFINASVYGKGVGRMGYWKIPIYVDKNNVVADVTFKGNAAEKVLRYASELIDVCLKNHEMNEVWKNIITKYNLLVAIMNIKENITDEKIDEFHEITFQFNELVCANIGYHCITNYLHVLGAGHVEYYLRSYKNL